MRCRVDSGNLIGDFDSEAAALTAVREEIELSDDSEALVLQRDEGTSSEFVAAGADMAELAKQTTRAAGAG